MIVLGIETSCDETAAAVVKDGREVLSNVVFSQTRLHRPYGGVVPEIASRSHVEQLPGVVAEAVEKAGVTWDAIDGLAVTYGPGLATSLLVGVSMAKGLAMRLGKPLAPVNHLEAHMYSAFLTAGGNRFEDVCPFSALVVSGGHTCLLRAEGLGKYNLIGQTIDDAAGEAFDKGANLLGLGYPGGPAIDKAARDGNPGAIRFPRGAQRKGKSRIAWLDNELCFSFSGLKTALLYHLKTNPVRTGSSDLADISASYQEAIVDALVERCERAVSRGETLIAAGGVALNGRLRVKLGEFAAMKGVKLLLPEPRYCADNAAMIAGLAGARFEALASTDFSFDIQSSLNF